MNLYKSGKIKIGDYVDYKPSTDTISYKPDGDEIGSLTGYTEGKVQEIKQENLKWQVYGYNSAIDKLLLIASTPTNQAITFSGSVGYVNYFDVLDSACNNLYSNSNIGCRARSVYEWDFQQSKENSEKIQ